jgi:signal transduction histidine kinase
MRDENGSAATKVPILASSAAPAATLAGAASPRVGGFRVRLLVAMMLVVSAVTLLALGIAQRRLAANVEESLQREFAAELDALERSRDVRHGMLVERCRSLVRRPRIRAAFEDDALDLLYDAARYELQDVMTAPGLNAEFYRFLDRRGVVIAPPPQQAVGALSAEEESELALPGMLPTPQVGYLARRVNGTSTLSEIIAMPILSSETGEPIAALVLGFRPFEFGRSKQGSELRAGVWTAGELHAVKFPHVQRDILDGLVTRAVAEPTRVELDGAPQLVFAKRLNPDSRYAAAFEVCVFRLNDWMDRQRELRWQVLGGGVGLMLVGFLVSHGLSTRLSRPVEQLAVDSEENRTLRRRAEAALELTSAELQRSARFSADASHQLKTPVAVLRAGLEELLAREKLSPAECDELSALIHQTYRLSSLIEDLLLLSRLDAGRLRLQLDAVNLSQLIEASLDDLSALPDEFGVIVDTDFPPGLMIAGEKRYTAIILQNLLENARKYNRPGGHVRIAAALERERVRLVVGNTGRPIAPEAQGHIFERFHRGAIGEDVPGYGLGLNLARELARLHQGDVRLLRSDPAWTEFEVTFRLAAPGSRTGGVT